MRSELAPEAKEAKGNHDEISTVAGDMQQQYPWLSAVTSSAPSKTKKRSREAASDTLEADAEVEAGSDAPRSSASAEDRDEVYDAVFRSLEDKRCTVKTDESLQQDMFRTSVLGGKWQIQRTGRTIYGIRVDARPKSLAADFCSTFEIAKSSSFEQNVYGEIEGSALAKLWAHRVGFLAAIWEADGRKKSFPRERLSEYEIPEELSSMLKALQGKSRRRAEQIQALAPK